MEKQIEIGTPLTIAGVKVIPVLEITTNSRVTKNSFYCSGTKQPKYIVIVRGEDRRAFAISGEEVPLSKLADELPDFDIFS